MRVTPTGVKEPEGVQYVIVRNPWGQNDGSRTEADITHEIPMSAAAQNFETLNISSN